MNRKCTLWHIGLDQDRGFWVHLQICVMLPTDVVAEIRVARIRRTATRRPVSTRQAMPVWQTPEALSLSGLTCHLSRWPTRREELVVACNASLRELRPLILGCLELIFEGMGVRHRPILDIDLDWADVVH